MRQHNALNSELLTLQQVNDGKLSFIIPSYQRPYVWREEDIAKLFDDICNACSHGENEYFIGTVLSAGSATSHQKETEAPCYELIDGQQRTTTLMLMAIALAESGVAHPIVDIPFIGHCEDQPRLRFAIRDQVQKLIQQFVFKTQPETELDSSDPYLSHLNVGLKVLRSRIQRLPDNDRDSKAKSDTNDKAVSMPSRSELAQYLYKKVCWVNNIVPTGLDLNRLFTTMNTAGVQLEASDILKAKLLKKISTQKAEYEAIWLCCQPMTRYFERNVKRRFTGSDWQNIQYQDFATYAPERFRLAPIETNGSEPKEQGSSMDKSKGLTIAELAKESFVPKQQSGKDQNNEEAENSDDDDIKCRSIIGFPLLLLHALRIFRASQSNLPETLQGDIQHRLHSKYLLKNFDNFVKTATEAQVKAFFETLWQVRFHFDDQVIKREILADGKEGELVLSTVSRSVSGDSVSFSRESVTVNALSQLQSVRYYTGEQSAQYWLTPFIARLITAPQELGTRTGSKAFKSSQALLERIDNQLSLTTLTQKEASFAQARSDVQPIPLQKWKEKKLYFLQARGVRFEHYWFYKLEYLLWKKMKNDESQLEDAEVSKFRSYRIRSKNSVEHVHAQNDENKRQLKRHILDSFGNLVLLSPGENSSYSNQDAAKKEIDFQRKPDFDALKLRTLFKDASDIKNGLTVCDIRRHRNKMLQLLSDHYEPKTTKQSSQLISQQGSQQSNSD